MLSLCQPSSGERTGGSSFIRKAVAKEHRLVVDERGRDRTLGSSTAGGGVRTLFSNTVYKLQ